VARQCRGPANYVYAGTRAFRNRECAACNYVNDTYLRCEDTRTAAAPSSEYYETKVVLEESVPYLVTLDFNHRRASVIAREMGSMIGRPGYHVTETIFDFPTCPDGRLYDPFSGQCLLIGCAELGWVFMKGECTPPTTKFPTSSGAGSLSPLAPTPTINQASSGGKGYLVTSLLTSSVHPLADAAVSADDYDEDAEGYFRQLDADDVILTSTTVVPQCPLVSVNDSDYVSYDNGSILVVSMQRFVKQS